MGIKNWLNNVGSKAANKVAQLACLSAKQVEAAETQRQLYFAEKPKPDDAEAEELTRKLLTAGGVEIYHAYLNQLSAFYTPVQYSAVQEGDFITAHNIRFFEITRWVVDRSEDSLEKLVNVYNVLSAEACNIALVFHRTADTTKVYLAVTNIKNATNNVDADNYIDRLEGALRGNFPGSQWKIGAGRIPELDNDKPCAVAIASNIPAEKSEKFISQTIEKLLDGVIPNVPQKDYTIILLATPILDVEERKLFLGDLYSALTPYASWTTTFTNEEQNATGASATVGLNIGASAGIQHGQNQADTAQVANTASSSEGTSEGEQDATSENKNTTEGSASGKGTTKSTNTAEQQNKSYAKTDATNHQSSISHNEGRSNIASQTLQTSSQITDSRNSSNQIGGSVGGSLGVPEVANVNGSINGSLSWGASHAESSGESFAEGVSHAENTGTAIANAEGTSHSLSEMFGQSQTQSTGLSIAENITKSFSETTGSSVSHAVSKSVARTLGRAVTNSVAHTAGMFQSTNFGVNFGGSFARGSTVTVSVGKSEGIQQNYVNYNIKHALELLEQQMKRLEESTALGMWDFAAYVLSEDANVASNVANMYLSLTKGEESYMSHATVNLWRGDQGDDSADAREICKYLRDLRHPLFGLHPVVTGEYPEMNAFPNLATGAVSLTGKELAYSLNFPRKSVPGLPVIECAEFGRNIATASDAEDGKKLKLGQIFHMNREETVPVVLAKKSLASHTFITGSTGAGKSNAVFQILEECLSAGVHFLVVEPAKGEYKHVFGRRPGVNVFGTNPYTAPLLKLNPFRFPKSIHVLEHLDRLVEIFNVCWPMYAAMPAVLKQAVEQSYKDCGWDLMRSRCKYSEPLYPSFGDVAENIRSIIDSSEYDTENKGAYKGSLLTRLQSLCNGLNGLVFTTDDLPDSVLFDQNTIVDLSRVGSSENKALMMGMLVLKLQEYRMAQAAGLNAELKHVTVLEEAHNLLRKANVEQTSEGGNLQAKSVEMLANAIAEMRTYGEGFLIADQAPGLLDSSVIRNTNTKIILRLPDKSDRDLVGSAANLKEEQIQELAKLPCGVAAVYQNEWIQPVLCKVTYYPVPDGLYHMPSPIENLPDYDGSEASEALLDCIMKRRLAGMDPIPEMKRIRRSVLRSGIPTKVKKDFLEYLSSGSQENRNDITLLARLLYDLCAAETAIRCASHCNEFDQLVKLMMDYMKPSLREYPTEQVELAVGLILQEQAVRDAAYENVLNEYIVKWEKGGLVW